MMRQRKRAATFAQSKPNLVQQSTSSQSTSSQSRVGSSPTVPRTSSVGPGRPARFNPVVPSSGTMPRSGEQSSANHRPPTLVDSRNPVGRPPLVRRSFPAAGLNVTARVANSSNPNRHPATIVSSTIASSGGGHGTIVNNPHRVVNMNMVRSDSVSSMVGEGKKCCCCCISSICSHSTPNGLAPTQKSSANSNSAKDRSTMNQSTNDRSIMNRSINSGTPNVRLLIRSVIEGTAEMKDLILNEVDLIFECKKCRNLFRSLINFLDHKRSYCKDHSCESMTLFNTTQLGIRYLDDDATTLSHADVDVRTQVQDRTDGDRTDGDRTQAGRVDASVNVSKVIVSKPSVVASKQVIVVETGSGDVEVSTSASVPEGVESDQAKESTVARESNVSKESNASRESNVSKDALQSKAKGFKSLDKCLEKLRKDKVSLSSTLSINSPVPSPPILTPSQPTVTAVSSSSKPPPLQVSPARMGPLLVRSLSSSSLQPSSLQPSSLQPSSLQPSSLSPKREVVMRSIPSNPNAVFQTLVTKPESMNKATPSGHAHSDTIQLSGHTHSGTVQVSKLSTVSSMQQVKTVSSMQQVKTVSPMQQVKTVSPMDRNNNDGRMIKTYSRTPSATIVTSKGVTTSAILTGSKDYTRTPLLTANKTPAKAANPLARPPPIERRSSAEVQMPAGSQSPAELQISPESKQSAGSRSSAESRSSAGSRVPTEPRQSGEGRAKSGERRASGERPSSASGYISSTPRPAAVTAMAPTLRSNVRWFILFTGSAITGQVCTVWSGCIK